MAANTVRLHRVLRAPAERIYRAFLNADAMAKWLPPHGFTGSVHHLDARVGGTYRMSFTNFNTGQSVANAQALITAVDSAIDQVNASRSTLGAVQNRLEHSIANLGVAHENLTASESRIRDTDMAAEMATFTKSQILQQAGTAILAQANQLPQSILKLLQ